MTSLQELSLEKFVKVDTLYSDIETLEAICSALLPTIQPEGYVDSTPALTPSNTSIIAPNRQVGDVINQKLEILLTTWTADLLTKTTEGAT